MHQEMCRARRAHALLTQNKNALIYSQARSRYRAPECNPEPFTNIIEA